MRELLVIRVKGANYGIWKDAVQSVRDVQTLHRLPLSPACIAGMSIIDDRTVTLADLPACIGYASGDGEEHGCILMLSGQEKITGFLVNGDISSLPVPPEAILPLPDCVRTDVIHSCSICDNVPVPLIDIAKLHFHLLNFEDLHRPSCAVTRAEPAGSALLPGVRIFSLGDDRYAVASRGVEERSLTALRTAEIPLAPRFLKGIAFHDGEILPVVDLSQRIQRKKSESGSTTLIQKISGVRFGLLVDEDGGTLDAADFRLAPLPQIVRSSWLQNAVLSAGQIIPLVDSSILLSAGTEAAAEGRREALHTPDSAFPALFKKQDVEIVEFSLLGTRHALPKTEVEDVIGFKPYRAIPNAPPIVVGVALHDGLLLPVVDLASVFGRRSIAASGWRMILVKNGDFRALVITETVFGKRRLPLDIHRDVPIRLPHHVVYGCYPESDSVKLILNVEAMVVHFEKSLVQELLPAMPQEMKRAAAELVPSLLGEHAAALESEIVQLSPSVSAAPETAAPALAGTAASLRNVGDEPSAPAGTIQKAEGEEEITDEAQKQQAEAVELKPEDMEKSAALEQAKSALATSAVSESTGRERETAATPERKEYAIAQTGAAAVASEEMTEKALPEQTEKPPMGITPDFQYEDAEKTGAALEQEKSAADAPAAAAPIGPEGGAGLAEERRDGAVPSEDVAFVPEGTDEDGQGKDTETIGEKKSPGETDEAKAALTETPFESRLPAGKAGSAASPSGEEQEAESASGSQPASYPQNDKSFKPEPERQQEILLEPQHAMQEAPAFAASEAQRFAQEKESSPESEQERAEQLPGRHQEVEQPVLSAAETHQYASSGSSWKRRIGIGALAAAVLAGMVYGIGVYHKPGPEKPVKEEDPPKMEQMKTEAKTPPAKKKETSLVLEIPAAKPLTIDMYVVVKGDTLWRISERFTGNPFNYPRIAGENRIANPDLIFPGQKIYLRKK